MTKSAITLTAANRARVISENPWRHRLGRVPAESAAQLVRHVDEFHKANPLLSWDPRNKTCAPKPAIPRRNFLNLR